MRLIGKSARGADEGTGRVVGGYRLRTAPGCGEALLGTREQPAAHHGDRMAEARSGPLRQKRRGRDEAAVVHELEPSQLVHHEQPGTRLARLNRARCFT